MSTNEKLTMANLNELQLGEFGYVGDPTARVRGTFPFSVATGNASSAMVYFELAPGCRLPTHTDSAEEILIVLQGTVEISVGEATVQAQAGAMAIVPSMEPHGVLNVGSEVVKVIGCFSSNTVLSTFEQPLVPLGEMPAPPEAQRTLSTPPPGVLEMTPSSEQVPA